ncbi:hypothetical protein Tco_0944255 [Tanacetum coccineum]
MFQRLGRYPTSVHVFHDPILFLAGLQYCWEHGQQRLEILVGGMGIYPPNFFPRLSFLLIYDLPFLLVEMAFRNFVNAKDEEDLSFLTNDPSLGFGTSSPSMSVNTKPLKAGQMKNKKCKTRRGPSRPPVKRKLASGSSTSRATRAKTSTLKDDVPFLIVYDDDKGLSDILELKDATACHLKISAITPPAWKNHLDNHMDIELLDPYDCCYAQQAVVDNVVNRRSRELLEVIEKLKGECDVIKEREREPKKKILRVFEMMLENQKWASYKASLSTLESQIVSLEAEKARLEAVKVTLLKEVDDVKQDRIEVVLKVVPYAAMEIIYSDDLGSLVGRLVSSAIFYGRCKAFKQVAGMKEPFDLSKVEGYHPSYKEHNQASNDLTTATFPWLSEFLADPSASVEVLLSKKPPSLQRPNPSKTQALVASSPKATPSYVLGSNPMSHPADASVVKPMAHVWPYNILLNVELGNMRLKAHVWPYNILTNVEIASSIEAASLPSFLLVTSFVLPLSSLATTFSAIRIMASEPGEGLRNFHPLKRSANMPSRK